MCPPVGGPMRTRLIAPTGRCDAACDRPDVLRGTARPVAGAPVRASSGPAPRRRRPVSAVHTVAGQVFEARQWHLFVALGIGLLIGLERERRKGQGPEREAAGVRTFALVALVGGLAAEIGGAIVLAVCGGFIALAAVVAYATRRNEDPGLTTQIALMTTFLLGALTWRNPALAAGLAVVVTVLLAARVRCIAS